MAGFYVCKIIGTGAEGNSFRPYIDNYPVNWVMAGEVGKGALVYVSNPTPAMEADSKIYVLPKDLDDTLSHSEWNALTTKLQDQGLTPGAYDPNKTVREIIIFIGTSYNPAFDLEYFYVD